MADIFSSSVFRLYILTFKACDKKKKTAVSVVTLTNKIENRLICRRVFCTKNSFNIDYNYLSD